MRNVENKAPEFSLAFQGRAEYGKLLGQLEDLIGDEESTHNVINSLLVLLGEAREAAPIDYSGLMRLLLILNGMKHLQFLQASSGVKRKIYD